MVKRLETFSEPSVHQDFFRLGDKAVVIQSFGPRGISEAHPVTHWAGVRSTRRTVHCHYQVIHYPHKPSNKVQTVANCHPPKASPEFVNYILATLHLLSLVVPKKAILMRFTHLYEALPIATVLTKKRSFHPKFCKNNTFELLLPSFP